MKAPFPWFGGKRRVASYVWDAFGDVDNYVEPFAGSLAVLLERPAHHLRRAETVNDADRFLSNFWRALKLDPEGVADHADWPVNEADLFARHLWLVNEGAGRVQKMEIDPDFYDLKVAGWWVWGINAWIGSGWCNGNGPWTYGALTEKNRQLPHLGDAGRGVNRQRPHLGDAGQGMNRATVNVRTSATLCSYFAELSDRLRRVRVCCGDWARVVTDGALNYGATKGVLLDPPYLGDVRRSDLYAVDDHRIANAVREWALAHGDDPAYRIVLCGYEDEHAAHMPDDWRVITYSANKSYGSSNGGGVNGENRHKERLWLSPHCLNPHQGSLFA